MSNMLEKAARALCETYHPEPYSVNRMWPEFVDDVRAVLLAVQEADDRMLRAAFAEMNRTPGRQWKAMKAANKTPREIFDAKERPRFTAMIDAILSEKA